MIKLPQIRFKNVNRSNKKETCVIGLDIGTSALKLVKVSVKPDSRELLGFINQPLSDADFPTVIKNMLAQLPLGTDKVRVSISGKGVVIRCINMPKMSEAELASAMRFEAEKHILFPLDQVIYDTQVLKEDPQANTMWLLIAAAKKEFINTLINRLKEAELSPASITIDSLALANAYLSSATDKSLPPGTEIICLLNIGATFTNLVIVDSGVLKLSRDIEFGGEMVTRRITEALNIDRAEAEELKCYAKTRQEELIKIYEPLLNNLASEMRDSFDYFETQNNATIQRIVLSGGSAKLAGLAGYLKNTLGIEVNNEWDPFINFKINASVDTQLLKNQMHRFAVACGLALND